MQTQMINLAIPKSLLKLVDKQAENELKTRSELLRDAIRNYLLRLKRWEEVFTFGRAKVAKLKIKPEELESLVDDYRQGK